MTKIVEPRSFFYDRSQQYINTDKNKLDRFVKIIPNKSSKSVFMNHVIQPTNNLLNISLFFKIMTRFNYFPIELTKFICLLCIGINIPYIIYKTMYFDRNESPVFRNRFRINDYFTLKNIDNIHRIDEDYHILRHKNKIHKYSEIQVFYNNKNFKFKNNNEHMLYELNMDRDIYYLIHLPFNYSF